MPPSLPAPAMLDREFLEIRARLLEVAAALDRIDRANGTVELDPRVAQITAAIDRLQTAGPSRAAELQQIFSLPFHASWRDTFGV